MENRIDLNQVKQSAKILRSLNHGLRQKMLTLMYNKPNITVTEIYKKLNILQCLASMHLSVLRGSKIVKTQREGKLIKYSINHETISSIDTFIKQLLK